MKKRIGWIGTGVMGASMAKHLLLANHSLVIFSRTRKKAESLEQNGAKWVNSPAEVARETDLILRCWVTRAMSKMFCLEKMVSSMGWMLGMFWLI